VGSGKSSLLNAVIGDMIYIPQHEIDEFGGLEKNIEDTDKINDLRKKLLDPKFKVD
jgi:ABC-type molybdenum transport system ATPase subunit/photorepair protein PhrA